MIYYAIAMALTMLLCSVNTGGCRLSNGAEARCFFSGKKAFLTLLPLCFLAVFRWDVGVDSLYGGTYWTAYHMASIGENSGDFEPGFYWLMRLFSGLGVPFYWFLFFLAVLFMACISFAMGRGSVWTGWSVLIFFLIAFYFDCYSSLRQSMAEAICLIGWADMGYLPPSRKKNLRIILIFILAGAFHITAWMCIPIFLICRIRFSRAGLLKLLLTALLATPVLQILISTAMQLLTDNPHYSIMGVARINALLSLVLAAIGWYFYDEIKTLDENAYMYVNFAICIFILLLNSGAMYLPYRVFDMLKIGYVFIVPYMLKGIQRGRIRLYIQLLILLMFGMWFVNYFFIQDVFVAQYQFAFSNWGTIIRLP